MLLVVFYLSVSALGLAFISSLPLILPPWLAQRFWHCDVGLLQSQLARACVESSSLGWVCSEPSFGGLSSPPPWLPHMIWQSDVGWLQSHPLSRGEVESWSER